MCKRFLRGVAAAAIVFAASPVLAQEFSPAALSEQIRIISADDFEGRYPGTASEEKTLAWLQNAYEEMGLKPGAPDGQWLQKVELISLAKAGEPVVSVKAADGTEIAISGLVARAVNDAGQGTVSDAGVVFAGYGITAPEREWDDYGDMDVTGKVVVVLAGSPEFNSPYRRYYAQEDYKADEAYRRGAAAVVVIANGDWTRTMNIRARPIRLAPGSAQLQFKAWVSGEQATAMGITEDVITAAKAGGFKATDLPLTLSAEVREDKTVLNTHNLLAVLPGTEKPHETIVYSAHWDHVGMRDPAEGTDHIFNGTWDNASGTIGVVEMARQFAKEGPSKRTVVFLHVTAEEMGLLGAYAYAANPVYPLETTVANINIDMLPLSGQTRDVPIFGKGQNTLEDMLDVLAKAEGRYVSDDGQPQQGFYYRSDHFAFARAGVPALMPWHGVDFVEGGIEVGKAAWQERFGRVYHKPTDEWSADLDFTSASENLTLLYRLGRELADGNVWPTWKADSEFGQVRARTEAIRATRH